MTDTTEASRLADDLLDDADQGQAHIPSLRKSASMLRALADENERMRADAERLDWIESLTNRAASSDMHMAHGRVALYVRTGIGAQIESQGWGSVRGAIDAARSQEDRG